MGIYCGQGATERFKSLTPRQIERIVRLAFDKEDEATVLAIMHGESKMNCGAVGDKHLTFEKNGTTYGASYGLGQIRYLKGRPTPEQLLDCRFNISYFKKMWDKQGGTPWTVFKRGYYKEHLAKYK